MICGSSRALLVHGCPCVAHKDSTLATMTAKCGSTSDSTLATYLPSFLISPSHSVVRANGSNHPNLPSWQLMRHVKNPATKSQNTSAALMMSAGKCTVSSCLRTPQWAFSECQARDASMGTLGDATTQPFTPVRLAFRVVVTEGWLTWCHIYQSTSYIRWDRVLPVSSQFESHRQVGNVEVSLVCASITAPYSRSRFSKHCFEVCRFTALDLLLMRVDAIGSSSSTWQCM